MIDVFTDYKPHNYLLIYWDKFSSQKKKMRPLLESTLIFKAYNALMSKSLSWMDIFMRSSFIRICIFVNVTDDKTFKLKLTFELY